MKLSWWSKYLNLQCIFNRNIIILILNRILCQNEVTPIHCEKYNTKVELNNFFFMFLIIFKQITMTMQIINNNWNY